MNKNIKNRNIKNKNECIKLINNLPNFIYNNCNVNDLQIKHNQHGYNKDCLTLNTTIYLELGSGRFFEIEINGGEGYPDYPKMSIKCYGKKGKGEKAEQKVADDYGYNDKSYVCGPGGDREYNYTFGDSKKEAPLDNGSSLLLESILDIKSYADLEDFMDE